MQNLTPLEIQKQIFSRALKGYNPDEVRGYLSLVAEEIERLVKDVDRLSRENAMLREELDDHSQRERILKDTLLSAQKVSEDVKANARKEAELIVKDAELLSERVVAQAMQRVSELERAIQDLKIERVSVRNRLQERSTACSTWSASTPSRKRPNSRSRRCLGSGWSKGSA